jgi:hypothetical protein
MLGSKFRGVSEASGGNGSQNSSSDCPVVQLRSIESGQVTNLSTANWQANLYVSLPVPKFPGGYALATVFVNGIPSVSQTLLVVPPAPTPFIINGPMKLPDGSVQLTFTNTPGAVFTVLAKENLSSESPWIPVGAATEISPGQFGFNDAQGTKNPSRFYRLRSP